MHISDVISNRSDSIPGIYSCVECGKKMPLEEAWREPSQFGGSFSTLFCAGCAQVVRQKANLNLAPINLTNMDKLNLGQFVPEFGVAAPEPQTGVLRWKLLLTETNDKK